ncbi:McrB family protein [Variovorax atrisoli]|uniref:McrB family protein n=1 Tax=Variovorax atrisoli TaxID=3394203 RepID=UPI003395E6D6
MSAYIGVERLRQAIQGLCDWRGRVKQQTVSHIFPLLALLEKGVTPTAPTPYEEQDDFQFFDKYCRVGDDPRTPYFDPFGRLFRIASHPHSNVATARKGTFARSWNAGVEGRDGVATTWQLSKDFAQIVRDRVLTKGTEVSRINVIDLAVWMFREEDFPDGSNAETLVQRFKERFRIDGPDFDTLFVFEAEPAASIFVNAKPTREEIDSAIAALAFADAAATKVMPPPATTSTADASQLEEDDAILVEIKALLELGTSGVILRGAPGTGKSWYAYQVALALTGGDGTRVFRLQFHPSFTYEDFFDGYVPTEESKSGFKIQGRIFRQAIEKASGSDDLVVVIIDEINRGDTARIFGESLTYIESGWRGVPFTPRLATEKTTVPRNLFVLATMNPHDRSITQLDMALLRRFDHVEIPPSREQASTFLVSAGMPPARADLVSAWFAELQNLLPFGLGHTFLLNVGDDAKLGLVWRYRIRPFCESILEFDQERLTAVVRSFEALEARLRAV